MKRLSVNLNNFKQPNICVLGSPKDKEEDRKISEEIMAKKFFQI